MVKNREIDFRRPLLHHEMMFQVGFFPVGIEYFVVLKMPSKGAQLTDAQCKHIIGIYGDDMDVNGQLMSNVIIINNRLIIVWLPVHEPEDVIAAIFFTLAGLPFNSIWDWYVDERTNEFVIYISKAKSDEIEAKKVLAVNNNTIVAKVAKKLVAATKLLAANNDTLSC